VTNTGMVVVKFGGELLEDRAQLANVVAAIRAIAARGVVVVVHGGGKEIDAALKTAGVEKRQVDGLRITDEATLDVVVAVLAGAVNTRLVAALNTAGVGAVGLTGADGLCGLSETAPLHRATDGRTVDLGRVGIPTGAADTRLLDVLTSAGFVPVIACIGIGADGRLFNVNADTFAGHLAAQLGAQRLIVAGTTPGVLDGNGKTVSTVDGVRRRNLPSLPRYVAALARGEEPAREVEPIDEDTRRRERLLLGLRLDEPVVLADVGDAVDDEALERLRALGLVEVAANGRGDELRLTRRGRFLGGGVTAELLSA